MDEQRTPQALHALSLAEESAVSLGHGYIGTEHLLIGLLAEKESTAGRVLAEFGVKPDRLLELIRELIAPPLQEETPQEATAVETVPDGEAPAGTDREPGKDGQDEAPGSAETDQAPETAGQSDAPGTAEPDKEPAEVRPEIEPAAARQDRYQVQAGSEQDRLSYSPRLRYVLEQADLDAADRQDQQTGTGHMLLAMLRQTDCVATRLIYTMGINITRLYAGLLTAMGLNPDNAGAELSMGSGQEGSLTPVLDKYSRDLTALAQEGRLDPVLGREKEISRLIQILSRRTKNNPCLVGEPGVGKTAIAQGLARRIIDGKVPEGMENCRLLVLDMAAMVAGTKYRGEFEERIRQVIDEVRDHAGILLFIDELHTIIGAGGAEGSLDAANILKPALSRGEIQIIGATTLDEYRKYIEKDAALERRFQPIMVEEPSREEAYEILEGLRSLYEKHHQVTITSAAIHAAVDLSERYITDRSLPDKAIDVMDEAAARIRLARMGSKASHEDLREEIQKNELQLETAIRMGNMEEALRLRRELVDLKKQEEKLHKKRKDTADGRMKVDPEAIAAIVSDWTGVPVQKLTQSETKRLAKLEKELHKRVVGQDEAVTAVAQAVKRGRVGLKDPRRPVGSFLFLGPTGVGKTELSKALAEAVYGSEQNMIRLDMSEYMEKHTVSRLIGSPPGYVGFEDGGQLSEKVRRHPYSVVLFDEIEKAHPDVFNILLQILDDGHITDSHGRKVDFRQTIIIMTSNAGAQAIIEPKRLGFVSGPDEKQEYEKMKSGVMEEVRRIFRPEFLNRIDEIMVFHPLNQKEIGQIVSILVSDLEKRCKAQMGITLKVSASAKEEIGRAGFDAKYGARPLRRQIQTRIEDLLANEILEGHFSQGSTVHVRFKNGKMIFI